MPVKTIKIDRWYRTCNSALSGWFVLIKSIKGGYTYFVWEDDKRGKPSKKRTCDIKGKIEYLSDEFIQEHFKKVNKSITQK